MSRVVELELPLFSPKSSWKPPRVSDLPSWKGAKRIGFDTETRDDDLRTMGPGVRRGAYIVGYSFSIEDGPTHYVPLRHFGGDNVEDPEQALSYLRDQAKHFDGDVVGANLGYDLDFAEEEGVRFASARWFRDVLIADPLIYELHSSYKLNDVAKRWGCTEKDESLLRQAAIEHKCDPKAQLWKLPARYVGPYGEGDSVTPLEILRKQEERIKEDGLQEVFDLESKLVPILVTMRRRGVLIDHDHLDRIAKWSEDEERRELDTLKRLSGRRLMLGEVNNNAALAPILKSIGVVLPKTAKTKKDRIDKEVLAGIDHPIAKSILTARRVNKLRTTFVASVRKFETNGRIHCTFNQVRAQREFEDDGQGGAGFGRFSCEKPNLQQQPSRADFTYNWRSIYLPEPGRLWGSVDYSQQEPRMAVHFAIAAGAKYLRSQEAFEAAVAKAKEYRDDPRTDFHTAVANMTGGRLKRKDAKQVGLAIMYGMGEARMCRAIGVPLSRAVWDKENHQHVYEDINNRRFDAIMGDGGYPRWAAGPEGRGIIQQFDDAAPYIRKLAQACQERAKQTGQIRTLSGRICHFPEKRPDERKGHWDKYEWIHKALNRLIQGSCGDQAKKAIVALHEEGFFLQLLIHDETTMSVESREEAEAAGEIMSGAYDLHLPFQCDVEVGPSWGEAK